MNAIMVKSDHLRQRKLRVMLDANTFFSAFYYPRFDLEILEHSVRGEITIVISPYILEQAREIIIKYIPDKLHLFENRFGLLDKEFVENPTQQQIDAAKAENLIRDPTDIPVAISAINAEVDYLITRDKDFIAEDKTTREIRRRVKVIKPQVFLREVLGWSQESLDALARRQWADIEAFS